MQMATKIAASRLLKLLDSSSAVSFIELNEPNNSVSVSVSNVDSVFVGSESMFLLSFSIMRLILY